jgi:N-acetylmuramoyl-L-alanine amidase
MIKRILLAIVFIIFFTHAVFAQEIFKITSVNFDTSNSMIFLTSPDNTTEAIMKNIKLIKLQNPKRVYFDINNAVLTAPAQNWFFNTGGVKQVKVNQFCTNPNKVRVLLYLEDDFDQSKISFLKVNNNIVIKFKDGMYQNEYFQNTYRDERKSSSDFYENLSISNQDIEKIKESVNTAKSTAESENTLNQIQQAFNSNTQTVSAKTQEVIKKELKLKSKYYLNLIEPKQNGFLLSGFGVVGIEKPMYLTNPARVVFDIPNTIVNPEIKNKEFKIGQDSIKIGQYESNKARIVITSDELEKYFPIFSADGQSVLFLNSEKIDLDSLFDKTTDAVGYYEKKLTPTSDEFIMAFSSPVVHSIRRDNSKLTINFYNALRYNDKTFRDSVEETDLNEMKIDLLPQVGLKLSIPLEKNSVVSCYLGSDGKSVKIVVNGVKPKQKICSSERNIILPKCNGKKSVVIDAGHGGSDYGAIRCGINEKDINLDVARRVQSILMNKGVSISMTRNTDDFVSLSDRTAITANTCPDIFVSIHVNSSSKPEICGIETHYYHQESLDLAQDVHSSLISDIKSTDRGLFKSKFYVINHTNVPAILVEIGFISNDAERSALVSEQRKQQTAQAIAEGILKYLNKK